MFSVCTLSKVSLTYIHGPVSQQMSLERCPFLMGVTYLAKMAGFDFLGSLPLVSFYYGIRSRWDLVCSTCMQAGYGWMSQWLLRLRRARVEGWTPTAYRARLECLTSWSVRVGSRW